MKATIKKLLGRAGLEVRRMRPASLEARPGSAARPVGDVKSFLEDLQSRGFVPRGILDIGANRGEWTRMALSVFPQARVLAIEPQREMELPLKQLCSAHPNVECVHAGAGRTGGQLVQTIWDDLTGSSFLPAEDAESLRSGRQRLTPVVTLDDLLHARPDFPPDLVKLDVQGFELEVLAGAASLFGRTQVFILETALFCFLPRTPTTADCINFMRTRGYEVYDATEFLRRPLDGALSHIDLAFAMRDGPLRHSHRWK